MQSTGARRQSATNRFVLAVGVSVLAVIGAGLTLTMTRNGMLGGPDAVAYLSATDNIASGKGITIGFETLTERYSTEQAAAFDGRIPIVLAPPGYPIATGALGALGLGEIAATRLVNALAVALGLGVAGWMLFSLSDGRWLAILGGTAVIVVLPAEAVLGVTQTWLGLATGPASEVPFIASAFVGLALIAGYLRRETVPWAVLAVAGVAASIMTRYIGTSLTLTLVLAVVLFGSGPFVRRLLRAAALGVLTVAPSVIWTTTNAWFLGANSPRAAAFHPPGAADSRGGAIAVADWFLPGAGGGWRLVALAVIALLVVVVIAAGFRALPRSRGGHLDPAGLLYRVLVLFIPCYIVLLVATRTFFDAGVPLGGKSIAPIQPVLVVVLIGALSRLAGLAPVRRGPAVLRVVPLGFCIVGLLALGWSATYDSARNPPPATLLPVNAAGASDLRSVPPGRLIVSNGPDAVFNLARRSSIAIPLMRDATTGKRNSAYPVDVGQLARLLRQTRGTLALFRLSPLGRELPARLGLELTVRSPTVDLWVAPAGTPAAPGP